MLTTNLKQLLGITLKNFFDIDITVFINLFVAVLTILAILKLYILSARNLAKDGWNTVKQDARNIKESLLEAKGRFENSDFKETLINTYRGKAQHH